MRQDKIDVHAHYIPQVYGDAVCCTPRLVSPKVGECLGVRSGRRSDRN
jgi:hypothetical protein